MNRKNLTAAVLAGLAGAAGIIGSAQAVNINPDGLGQVLIYPYYTVNGGNTTLLSVVNTTGATKAVKVRFTEGQNTREVLDFNLYMSMYDVWTAALYDDAGTPTMVTSDTTCTVPYIYGNGGKQAFLPYALTDGGSTDISRATEGHFEMIEMGEIVDGTTTDIAATHVNGVPGSGDLGCHTLVEAWTDPNNLDPDDDGYWLMDPIADFDEGGPTGGLFGGAAIVNVKKGTMFSYDAKAINGFSDSVLGSDGFLHQEPGSVLPSLNSGNIGVGTVFLDDGTTHTSSAWSRTVDAVSFVFMHDQVMNEYTTEAAVNAGTEWVMTFPTKHFYVYGPSAGDEVPLPVDPFTSQWDPEFAEDAACELVVLDTIWDREEREIIDPENPGTPIPPIVSPAPPDLPPPTNPEIPLELCYEVSVIAFGPEKTPRAEGGTTAILGSSNFHNIDNELLGFEYGWARLDFSGWDYDLNGDGVEDEGEVFDRVPLGGLVGLPVTGFAVQKFENGFLDGNTLANYGGIFQHKATRSLVLVSPQ